MENIYETGLEFIRWLQTTWPQLQGFFLGVSSLGREEFYLVILTLVYWCINKKAGRMMGYLLFFAVVVNTMLKHALRQPRPFWIDPQVGLEKTGGYGIPSGHTQYATALYFLVAYLIGGFWIWLAAGILVLLMALSRIYLGAHFPQDVLGGFLVGGILLALVILWDRRIVKRFKKRILGQRMFIALMVVFVLCVIYLIMLFLIGEPNLSVPWASYIPEAELASYKEMSSGIGILLGFSVGIVLENSRIRFRADGPIGKRIVRYLVGIITTVVVWQGFGMIVPDDPLSLVLPLRFIQYFLLAFWAAYYAPWLFVRLRLADTDPEPEMSLRL
ncbi:MAG: phosphatase PAP2 family protein [Candidatus Promineifilaceae bacterium]|jgi:membrane-associated phospholipid phosphatase